MGTSFLRPEALRCIIGNIAIVFSQRCILHSPTLHVLAQKHPALLKETSALTLAV